LYFVAANDCHLVKAKRALLLIDEKLKVSLVAPLGWIHSFDPDVDVGCWILDVFVPTIRCTVHIAQFASSDQESAQKTLEVRVDTTVRSNLSRGNPSRGSGRK